MVLCVLGRFWLWRSCTSTVCPPPPLFFSPNRLSLSSYPAATSLLPGCSKVAGVAEPCRWAGWRNRAKMVPVAKPASTFEDPSNGSNMATFGSGWVVKCVI